MKRIKRLSWILSFSLLIVMFSGIHREAVKAAAPSVEYQAHIENEGWKDYQSNGAIAGSVGKSLSLQALRIRLKDVSGGIIYQAHLANIGWTSWMSNDAQVGTTGQNRPMEAIRIKLTGNAANQYDVYYRAHVPGLGWLGWAKNGDIAGSTGCSLRMEAIQIKILSKNNGIATTLSCITKPVLTVQAHVEEVGWQNQVAENAISGTTGQSKGMEAMIITCKDFSGGNGIQYRAHVQNIGWQNWCNSGGCSGTTGRSLQMEAVQIKLTGQISVLYDVYYRVHCNSYGWLGWACNGESAGTTGGSVRMEAIQIKLVRKGIDVSREGRAYQVLNGNASSSSTASVTANSMTKTVEITYNGQTVDTFNGVAAKYIKGIGNSNTGTYCCARYVSNYYKAVYGVTVANMYTGATPTASSGYFSRTYSPKAGDIGYQLNSGNSGHWFIIKSVNSDGTYTVIEQNWKYPSGGKTYCTLNRRVSNSTKGFKAYRWSKRKD